MTVKIVIGHNANSREVFEALKDRLEVYANAYNDYKGFAGDELRAKMYLTLGNEMEELLVELFDAKVGTWGTDNTQEAV